MRAFYAGVGFLILTPFCFGQTPESVANISGQRAMVDKYCAGCHNDKLKSGGFSWSMLDLAHPEQNLELTEKVIRKLTVGMMPPAGAPRPEAAVLKSFATALAAQADKATPPLAGAPELHRLSRTEYRNSVRDLLDVDVDVNQFLPPDNMSNGFDNLADGLTVSPALMQGYIRAAGKISRLAVGDPQATPTMAKYDVPKVVNQMRHVDGAPLGTRGGLAVVHDFPADGEYTFKAVLYYYYTEELFGVALPAPLQDQEVEISVDGERVGVFTIDPTVPERNANYITAPIKVTAGPHRVAAAFVSKFDGPVQDQYRLIEQVLLDVSIGLEPGMSALPQLHTLLITGPMTVSGVSETPSRKKIFTCRPANESDEVSCAKKILTPLVRQAFRRPATDSDLENLLAYYQSGRNEEGFETGIRNAVQAILANPEFVFRFERVPANVSEGKNFRISDLELASRLSYFLWSSAPDEQLVTLASQGKLKDGKVLEQQVRRMLADERSQALVRGFAGGWLRLQDLNEISPDGILFPDFTKNLAQSMRRETELLFSDVMRNDRSVPDLLTADYTYVDEILAKHYGIPNVLGSRFRRVPVTDTNRLGLLGHGSLLTLTSLANRTSPVARGKYVMEVLLGAPPPLPPPNVPPLKENLLVNERPLSVRERIEQHRANEPCASCHKMMDPIGLSLENFDAVGRWRVNDSGYVIDASGQLFDGTKLDGPVSLRSALLSHTDAFLGNFTENLLAYGVGRLLKPEDMRVVRSIERDAAKSSNRFSAFILGVVKSAPFQMRTAGPMSASGASAAAR